MGNISMKELLHQAPYNTDDRADKCPPTADMIANANVLIRRVNALLAHWSDKVQVSSGYRPPVYNKAAGGSTNSAHMTCEAVDIKDIGDKLDLFISENAWLLVKYNLYREHPLQSIGWVHLTTRAPLSGNRTFKK